MGLRKTNQYTIIHDWEETLEREDFISPALPYWGGGGGGERVVSGIQHPRNSITLNHWQLSVEDLFKSISLSELTAVCVQGLDREQPRKRPQKGDHRSEVMGRSSDEQK